MATYDKANNITELVPWMHELTTIDCKRQTNKKRRMEEMETLLRANKRPNTSQYSGGQPPQNRSTTKDTSSDNTFPPRLTPEERKLLQDHEGCFKCRKFYAGHRSSDCTVVLSGVGYKMLTAADAARALKAHQKSMGTTSNVNMVSDTAIQDDMVAAIFPDSLGLLDDDFGDTSDQSIMSVSAPLKCDHLLWNCVLNGPKGLLTVTALIDSGAHLVLMRPNIAARLGLSPIPLANPEIVNVALSQTTANAAFTHYVEIEPRTRDRKFQSNRLHAVLAENLSVPLILGMPFLVTNHINCNYARRECNVRLNGVDCNILNVAVMPEIKQNDILASISEKACNDTQNCTLAELEEISHKEYSTVFEPLPHTDQLPMEPVACIRLKDPNIAFKTRNYACPPVQVRTLQCDAAVAMCSLAK
jgi:hypothetical protein